MYAKAYGIPVVVTRCFNVTGYGRADVFADSSWAKAVVEIERGLKHKVIRHGNLSSERDFVDVDDATEGYILAMEKGETGEIYCFASGVPRPMREVMDTLIANSTVQGIQLEVDPTLFRPIDTKTMRGDSTKARTKLGWTPCVEFANSMRNLLDYWRTRL